MAAEHGLVEPKSLGRLFRAEHKRADGAVSSKTGPADHDYHYMRPRCASTWRYRELALILENAFDDEDWNNDLSHYD